MSAELDRLPNIGITKAEYDAWMANNERNYTDPWRNRHTVGRSKSQSEYEIRAKIPRTRKTKETASAR